MKKRREARIKKSLLVDISKNGLEQMGVTVNISRRGMCIATTEVIHRHSKLQIFLAAADDIYAVTGLVVWKKKKKDLLGEEAPVGLGIQIEKAPRGYYQYLSLAGKKPLPAVKRRRGG